MKRMLIFLILFALLPLQIASAAEIKERNTIFETGKTYTIELIAKPEANENAVKINVIVSGAQIEDLLILNPTNWLSVTNDCSNGKKFSETQICATYIKTSPINTNETLGFIKIKVTDSAKLSIYKIAGTQYSNGKEHREDLGELITTRPNTSSLAQSTSANTFLNLNTDDPLIFYILIGLGVVVFIMLLSTIILAFRKKA